MKHHPWLSYLILVSVFFPIGLWTGSRIAPSKQKSVLPGNIKSIFPQAVGTKYPLPTGPESPQLQSDSTSTERSQTNLLILFVDELNSPSPHLISAWLLIHPKGTSRLLFLPIFQEDAPISDLVASFQIDHQQLSKRFIKAIAEHQILWHSYILVDQTVQRKIIADIAHSELQENILSIDTLSTICTILPLDAKTLSSLKRFIPDHLAADFNLDEAIDLWQYHLSGTSNLRCEFPTLSK
ncbi:MAG: hypothetical protein Kow0088_14460 [Anaerolineales bacterium]